MSYYDRSAQTNVDGTPIFKSADDERNETAIANVVSAAWQCEVRSFGRLSAIDWFAERNGRVVGLLELKSRSHATGQYPSVFFNLRKWLALMLAGVATGVPAIFIVRFTDGVRWVPVNEVDARAIRVAGCNKIVKARSDIEPIIDVPVASMRVLNVVREEAA